MSDIDPNKVYTLIDASRLDTRINSALFCQIDNIFKAASNPYYRIGCEVQRTNPATPAGVDREMAWFPASHVDVWNTDVLSALLGDTTGIFPGSTAKYRGMIQIYKDKFIWLILPGQEDHLYNIEWKNLECHGTWLHGIDDDGGTWEIYLDVWHAGVKPDWPEWPEWAGLPKHEGSWDL